MAKSIKVETSDGITHEYNSSLLRGYHLHQASNGICITEKPLLGKEQVVACYLQADVQNANQVRCIPCEKVNPTQRSGIDATA